MKKVEGYQAKDGKFFLTEEECQYHERHLDIKESFKEIVQYCKENKDCESCIYDEVCKEYFDGAPKDWILN